MPSQSPPPRTGVRACFSTALRRSRLQSHLHDVRLEPAGTPPKPEQLHIQQLQSNTKTIFIVLKASTVAFGVSIHF